MNIEMETGRPIGRTAGNPSSATRRGAVVLAAAIFTLLQFAIAAGPAAARWNSQPGNDDGSTIGSEGPPPYVSPAANGFNWNAPNRYSQWVDAWHPRGWTRPWPTETYRPGYVNPTKWDVIVQGCESKSDYDYDNFPDDEGSVKPKVQYRWKWNGHSTQFGTDCYTALEFPSEGTYWVDLTIKYEDGDEQTYTRAVRVKDLLIVVLGDSSASGEGAVDQRIYPWSPEGVRAEWVDNRCHRSENAGGAQAAKALEQADPESSVTFISLACSGASLDTNSWKTANPLFPYLPLLGDTTGTGITGEYVGIEDPEDGSTLKPQTQALWEALTDNGAHPPRKIDVLITAAGINDAQFSNLAAMCVLYDNCYAKPTDGVDPLLTVDDQFDKDVHTIPAKWSKFRQQLDDFGIQADKRLALEYPPFLHDDDGSMCLLLFHDVLPPLAWFPDEISWANSYWAPQINEYVRIGATQGPANTAFTWVDGIADGFYRHGMCADNRYINTASDSADTEGNADGVHGVLENKSTKGVAHPNKQGYTIYRDLILNQVESLLDNNPPVAVSDELSAAAIIGGWVNVLDNDTDVDNDTLQARVFSPAQHGTVTVEANGKAFYKPTLGYVGADSFLYEVTDGEYTRFTSVNVTVKPPVLVTTKIAVGTTSNVEGMLAGAPLDPPYEVVFDKPLPATRGEIIPVPHTDSILFSAVPKFRRNIKMPYTVWSRTTDVTSPSYGHSVRGVLKIRTVPSL